MAVQGSKTISPFTNFALKISYTYDQHRIKAAINSYHKKQRIKLQTLCVDDHNKYGSDVACARYVLKTSVRGRVTLTTNPTQWLTKSNQAPSEYDEKFRLYSIDLADCSVLTEGIDNLVGLKYLKNLYLPNNPELDDFACDQLARNFRQSKSLSLINVSANPLITIYGIERLLSIPSLKRIVLKATTASKYEDFELFSCLAEHEKQCRLER